jgi:thermostable 8-oxoguanine DNA glycosylase
MTTATKETTTVTMQQTHEAMMGLIQHGKRPNAKLAFWNACLSTRNRLDRNCKQAQVMRQYVDKPLPINRDELKAQLGPVLSRTLKSLYEIERLYNLGLIHMNAGYTFEEQALWRASMYTLIEGMGMKTISFALHIYAPMQCKLLTIDCWHLRRLVDTGYLPEVPNSFTQKKYLQLEQVLYNDIHELEKQYPGYAPIEYAAYLWECTRHAHNASQADSGEYQDHCGLSCYV